MPVPAATNAIDAQIGKAEPWLQTMAYSQEGLRETRNIYYRWIDYNELLLKQMFSDDSVQKDYQDSTRDLISVISAVAHLGEDIQDFQDQVRRHINALLSVKERLSLFEHTPASNQTNPTLMVATVELGKKRLGKKVINNKVFVVHGHDDAAKLDVQQLLVRLKFDPIILNQQVNKGRTIIEKFTDHAASTVFAVVLLTPDDEGYSKKDGPAKQKDRARQNVVLELGFFLSELGRDKVCALCKGDIEIPSDYDGVIYTKMDTEGAWKTELAKEMKAAGLPVDLNDL
jgi:predicted nucleotide-binding protein